MTNLSPRFRRISRVLKNTAQIPAFLLIAAFTIQDSPPKPDESRFTPIVVAENLDEPMVFEVLPDGSAYIIERRAL